jgi:hypothetical protein
MKQDITPSPIHISLLRADAVMLHPNLVTQSIKGFAGPLVGGFISVLILSIYLKMILGVLVFR